MWTVVKREFEKFFVKEQDGYSHEEFMGYSEAFHGAQGKIEGIDVHWADGHLVLGHGDFWTKERYFSILDVPAEKRHLFELCPCYWEKTRIPLSV